MTTLVKPDDLSLFEIHSPAVQAAHRAAVAAYYEQKREEEKRIADKALAAEANANRALTPDEEYQAAVKRHEAQKAKAEERRMAEVTAQLAEAAYLASLPAIAEVSERSEHTFLLKLAHWLGQGYSVADDSVIHWLPGFYCVQLHKPAGKKAAK
jgi:hypothetical protein